MAKTEKIFYILEQVRLCLDRKDFIRRAPWLTARGDCAPDHYWRRRSDQTAQEALTGKLPPATGRCALSWPAGHGMQAVLVCMIM